MVDSKFWNPRWQKCRDLHMLTITRPFRYQNDRNGLVFPMKPTQSFHRSTLAHRSLHECVSELYQSRCSQIQPKYTKFNPQTHPILTTTRPFWYQNDRNDLLFPMKHTQSFHRSTLTCPSLHEQIHELY
jgi:hypothetical protein